MIWPKAVAEQETTGFLSGICRDIDTAIYAGNAPDPVASPSLATMGGGITAGHAKKITDAAPAASVIVSP